MNFWQVVGGGWRNFEIFDDLDTRGGPPILRPGNSGIFYRFNSDSRKPWSIGFYETLFQRRRRGHRRRHLLAVFLIAAIGSAADVSLDELQLRQDPAQWIQNSDTDGDGVIDHVYGTLDRDVVDVTVRTTYAYTRPDRADLPRSRSWPSATTTTSGGWRCRKASSSIR